MSFWHPVLTCIELKYFLFTSIPFKIAGFHFSLLENKMQTHIHTSITPTYTTSKPEQLKFSSCRISVDSDLLFRIYEYAYVKYGDVKMLLKSQLRNKWGSDIW